MRRDRYPHPGDNRQAPDLNFQLPRRGRVSRLHLNEWAVYGQSAPHSPSELDGTWGMYIREGYSNRSSRARSMIAS